MSLLPVAEARARLIAMARTVPGETLPLAAAAGRWLAEPVIARHARPPANLSAMDGYALRFADLPGPLRVIGESAAGRPFNAGIGPGEATRIFTGAALPPGADAILVQEEARREGDMLWLAGEGPGRPGRNIRLRGMDFAEGTMLIAAGERLTPPRIALAAAAGYGALRVNRRLTIGLIATGDELRAPGTVPDAAGIPESNGVMLAAMLAGLPADVIDMGIVADDLAALTAAFAGFRGDILVTSGGASVGDHDLVRPALEAAGGTMDFWRIAMRPGKPMLAGKLGSTVLLGLPGNPVSAYVTATLFLRPLIAAMAGATDAAPLMLTALLGAPLPANDHREDYLRADLRDGHVFPAERQDSSMLATLAQSSCLVVRPAYAPAAQPGDPVRIMPLA